MRGAAKVASPAIVAQCGHSLKSSLRHVYRQLFMLGDSTFSQLRYVFTVGQRHFMFDDQ